MAIINLSFEEVHEIAKKVDGWLSDNEAKLLYRIASSLTGNGVIVEIGSWCGKSMLYETSAAFKNGFKNKIYSIDPYLTSKDESNGQYDNFIANLKQFDLLDAVTHIKEKSQIAGETFDEPIEFIFIDGFHKYDAVKKDFNLFYPKIIENGFMAIHDVCYYQGPTDLVIELAQSNSIKFLELCDSIILIQKCDKLDDSDIERNKKIVDAINAIICERELIK